MATSTTNLGLTKPAVNDAADIGVLNSNFDKIDAKFGANYCADCNNATKNGWYRFDANTLNIAPTASQGSLFVRTAESSSGVIVYQTMWNGYWRAYRFYGPWDGTWAEWEFENPPMQLGVEYRTTERWQGNAVYTKLVDCGQVTDGKTVYYSVYGMTQLIRHAAKITTATFGDINLPHIYGDMGSSYTAYCYANAASCGFKVGANATGQGYLQIWYTKD